MFDGNDTESPAPMKMAWAAIAFAIGGIAFSRTWYVALPLAAVSLLIGFNLRLRIAEEDPAGRWLLRAIFGAVGLSVILCAIMAWSSRPGGHGSTREEHIPISRQQQLIQPLPRTP